MAYWLLKTEPSTYSFDGLLSDKKTVWDGVTNNLALIHIRAMKRSDLAFIYHSGDEKAIVGIAEITKNPYPDPHKNDPKLVVIEIKAIKKLNKPVPLSHIKKDKKFAGLGLVRNSRLSVMPVSTEQWQYILKMAK